MAEPQDTSQAQEALDVVETKVSRVTFAATSLMVGTVLAPISLVFGLGLLPGGGLGLSGLVAAVAAFMARIGTKMVMPARPDRSAETGDGKQLALQVFSELQQANEVALWTGRYVEACLVISRSSAQAAAIIGSCGVVMHGASAIPVIGPFLAGPALAAEALALAMARKIPVMEEVFEKPVEEFLPEGTAEASEEEQRLRPTGQALMAALKAGPLYRRQVVAQTTLAAKRLVLHDKGLEKLLERYPRLRGSVLEKIGITSLSDYQARALADLLAEEEQGDERHRDFVFYGWAGSGRTTLVNLLAVGGLLHREGALYCVSASGPLRSMDLATGDVPEATARHPASQLHAWLDGTDHTEGIQEAYEASEKDLLDHSRRLDVVFTDVRKLSDEILAKSTGDARPLLHRLRYVVIDHPDRLPREELIRLRIAIARLRLTAELYGRKVTFIVLLPRLDNKVRFAKWLLNNQDVGECNFEGSFQAAEVVGWLPPFEAREVPGKGARFVRADFSNEVIDLLAELGFQAQTLLRADEEPLRLAVVDAQPLLGPELREHVRVTAIRRLQEAARAASDDPADMTPIVLRQEWTWFSTATLAVSRTRAFDVIVCVGLGSHPDLRVSSLRAALAEGGAMVLVGDGSPEDYESLREVGQKGWDPGQAIEDVRYSSVLWPDHSGAVIAHELACLFEDFQDKPVPRARLAGVFPGEQTEPLLQQWLAEGKLEELTVFETLRDQRRPDKALYLRRKDPSFNGQSYEVLWGTCSRVVFGVYDKDARNDARRIGVSRSAFVDRDRLFVDLYPGAMLRHMPHTVQVESCNTVQLSEREKQLAEQRWVKHGSLLIGTPDMSDAVQVDRRAARFEVALEVERPFGFLEVAEVLAEDSLEGVLRAADVEQARVMLAGLTRDIVPPGGAPARLLVGTGNWVCQIREAMRDYAFTKDGLVEEPDFVGFRDVPPALRQRLTRSYQAVATSIFLETTELGAEELCGDGWFTTELAGDRAAHHALLRCVRLFLERQFLAFASEYRLTLVANEGQGVTGFRLLVYRLREDELHADEHLGRVLVDKLDELFEWVHDRLERCECEDGCSACCAGLGVISRAEATGRYEARHYGDGDVVSRRGAYLLACAVLGREPDWDAYHRRAASGPSGKPPETDADLAALVKRVIGTEARGYVDGLWSRVLFGDRMSFRVEDVAPVAWMADDDPMPEQVTGYYRSGINDIRIRKGRDEDELITTLVHEFAHNWQFTAPDFDRAEHVEDSESLQYFDGKLVLEGHARWADHMYRLHAGLGAIYKPTDEQQWDAYKVGYYLMQGIEKALGQDGLFYWLQHGQDVVGELPRSRNARLALPFSLTEALEALDLLTEAREGRFDGIDIVEEPVEEPEPEAEPPPPPPDAEQPVEAPGEEPEPVTPPAPPDPAAS